MSDVDLLAFVGTDPAHPLVTAPWSAGEFTFATNGHVMIRVPRVDGIEPNSEAPDLSRVLAACSFERLRPVPYRRLPPLRFTHREFEIEGDDSVTSVTDLDPISGDINGIPFALRYIHLLFSLPGLRIGAQPDRGGPLPFDANAGVIGALMPLQHPLAKHYPRLIEVAL